jgi:tetratricopeptide (TPR) repeat protein
LGDYGQAVRCYEAALREPDYQTPYKAQQGMAGALAERGRLDEAAAAYRRAAIDPANPEPGKALVNLGLCFMGLGRPADAVDAYTAALGFDEYKGRGKALANLGQAYASMGQYDEAVKAFEKSTRLHGHRLSPTAQQAYDSAVQAGGSARETVDGWETGELPASLGAPAVDSWDTGALASLGAESGVGAPPETVGAVDAAASAARALGMGDDHDVSSFFSMTEEDMRIRDREARRVARLERRSGIGRYRSAIAVGVIALVVIAAFGIAYWFGFGWPTQKTTVTGLISAYAEGQPIDRYWVAVPQKDMAKEMAKIPPVKEFEVVTVTAGPKTSIVKLTVTPEKGAALRYVVTLSREGVGWRVTGIANDWGTSGG